MLLANPQKWLKKAFEEEQIFISGSRLYRKPPEMQIFRMDYDYEIPKGNYLYNVYGRVNYCGFGILSDFYEQKESIWDQIKQKIFG